LKGPQRHICTISGTIFKHINFTWCPGFLTKLANFPWFEIYSLNLSICFENDPYVKSKVLSWFSPLKISTCKCWFGIICNFYLPKKIAFQQLQDGCVMSSIALHLSLRILEVHFSVLTQFLVVHVSSNPKNSCMQIPQTLWWGTMY